MAITINVSKNGEWEVVSYHGPIDEEAEVHLSKIAENLGPNVKINFKNVTMVNSCGVRSWVNFIRSIEPNRSIVYTECTPEIVMQINMIPSFKGNAEIESLYGNYICDNCGHNQSTLFVKGQNLPQSGEDEVPPPSCGKCGEEMEMEEIEEEFFAFLAA